MGIRSLFFALSIVMILALVLVSCGKTEPATTVNTQTQTTTTTTTKATTATTTATTVKTTATTVPTTVVTTTTSGPRYGGILRIGERSLTSVLGNPAKMAEGYAKRQVDSTIETLLRIGKTGQLVPWLAKSWTVDATAMTITLTLNTGIMFSDNTPFNAAAVKWNLDQDIAAKQTGTVLMKSVDVINDSTVRINLSQWDNTILDMLGYSYIGMIISPTTAQKHDTAWIGTNPVGTGPFLFETWIPQVTISYSKNPNYWQTGKPYLDRVEVTILADQTVGLLNFKAGKTDIFVDPIISDVPDLLKQYPNTNILPFGAYATCRSGAIFDSADAKSPFKDLSVRQAVQYAINTEQMNQVIFAGIGQVTQGFLTKDGWAYNPDVKGYPYNPTKAKQLLSDAGFAPGQLKTNYYYTIGSPYEELAQAVKGYLKEVGIDITLFPTSSAQMTPFRQKWDGLCTISAVPSPDPASSFRDRYIGIDARYFQEMLIPSDYKQAVTNALTAPDSATKKKYAGEADKLFTDKYCLAVIWPIQAQAAGVRSWVHDHGMFAFPDSCIYTAETAWKDPGH